MLYSRDPLAQIHAEASKGGEAGQLVDDMDVLIFQTGNGIPNFRVHIDLLADIVFIFRLIVSTKVAWRLGRSCIESTRPTRFFFSPFRL